MENLIASNNYSPSPTAGTPLHVVLCESDYIAQDVTRALLNAGFTADYFPIITGAGCDINSVKNDDLEKYYRRGTILTLGYEYSF